MQRKEGFTGTLIVILLGTAFAIGGLVGGIVGGGLALWAFAPRQPIVQEAPSPTASPTPPATATATPFIPPTATPTPVVLATPSTEDMVEAVLPAVVTIANQKKSSAIGSVRMVGSGVVVDASGYIVTNGHVVADADTLTVTLADGTLIPAKLVVFDATQDLALLKIDADKPLSTITWGDSNLVRLGQPVLALGSPLGDFPNSVTMGIVSGLNRALAYDDAVLFGLIQTDAAINTGNSGGPLINMRGEVVGINTFIIRGEQGQNVAEGIGFAIPASAAKLLSTAWMADASPDNAPSAATPAGSIPLPAAQPGSP